jgi:glycosyltransferase involved in cell wall biosynthesis
MPKLLIATDAWLPQINGVVRTLQETMRELGLMGYETSIVAPHPTFPHSIPCPTYPDIRLELRAFPYVSQEIESFAPDFIHIATEGPIGWASRKWCLKNHRAFTTAYHTKFPEYINKRVPGLLGLAYKAMKRFHRPSSAIMVATQSLEDDLIRHGFNSKQIMRWSRGVDFLQFRPYARDNVQDLYKGLPRPILLNVGRVAVEKNLPAFLELSTPGSKVVIGDGPALKELKEKYRDVHFLGGKTGEDLARHYAAADLFVFPSHTDTFGLVLLEACAAGLPIAAYPAPGPRDIFVDESCHSFVFLDVDLEEAVKRALASLPCNSEVPRTFAARFSWQSCTEQFGRHLQAQTIQAIKRVRRFGRKIAA